MPRHHSSSNRMSWVLALVTVVMGRSLHSVVESYTPLPRTTSSLPLFSSVRLAATATDPLAPSRRRAGSTRLAATTVDPTMTAEPITSSFTDSINWQAQWWPIAFTSVTGESKPYPFELLSTPIVIWWDPLAESWNTVEDTCPQRLAPLSEGRIDPSNGCIECPYHGWTFEGKNGACTRIPQLEEGDPAPEMRAVARVAAYPTTVAQGIIWVWAQSIQSLNGQLPDPSPGSLMPAVGRRPGLSVSRCEQRRSLLV